MIRMIVGILLILFVAAPSFAQQQSLVGTYQFIKQTVVLDGVTTEPMGRKPSGYLIITPTRLVMFVTAENRKSGTSMQEKAGLLDSLVAWSGPYRIEGNKIIVKADASWVETWTGKDQVRNWELSGKRLSLFTEGIRYSRDPSKIVNTAMEFEKIE